jgi:triphosphoribosyl-dephospho-CoA synthase
MGAARLAFREEPGSARRIGELAAQSLYAELALYPKPGLVNLRDGGAHADMNAATFVRSIAALRGYFVAIADAGARGASFTEMQRLGIDAEARMMSATRGVNTHRGAIFTLGLLAAAAGASAARGCGPTDASLRGVVATFRNGVLACAVDPASPPSHGRVAAARYGAGGARREAAAGFPSVFEIGLPALRFALARTGDARTAQLHALFALLARVEDTNLLYRGGPDALRFVAREAAAFVARGGMLAPNALSYAEHLHRACCARGISPGGCADLLAASWFVHRLQTGA